MLTCLLSISLLALPVPMNSPAAAVQPSSLQDGYPLLAPFTGVRWDGDSPEVRVDGVFMGLVSLDGHTASELVKFCKQTYGRRSQKRFAEDLVQVLTEMGAAPGPTVDLVLMSLDGSERRVERKAVSMTHEKRQAARNYEQRPEEREAAPVTRVNREHAQTIPDQWAALFAPAWVQAIGGAEAAGQLTQAQAAQDLDQLEWFLEDQFSYLRLHDVDYRGALDAIRSTCAEGVAPAVFALQLNKLMALFGDAHSRVNAPFSRMVPPGTTSFLLMDSAQGVACVRADRLGPLDAEYPYLVAIDGVPVEEWVSAASSVSSAYSPAFSRRVALRNLRYIGWVAMELGQELGGELELTLSDGEQTRKLSSALASRRAAYGAWPRRESGILDGNIGYLRITSMGSGPEFLGELREAMQSFQETRGLIIDVRGNGGGSRDALRLLYPYLMAADEAPAVVNVAKYRLRAEDDRRSSDGYLGNRALFPASWSAWNQAEREAIASFTGSFKPAWQPAQGEFSDWHYMLLSPSSGEGSYSYGAPVKLLLDSGCFSATDIFASAFKGRANVELIGTPTGGGSGRSKSAHLAHSGLAMRLSSMASFQKDGQCYDGVGVQPDHRVEQPAEFFWGGVDRVLAEALARF